MEGILKQDPVGSITGVRIRSSLTQGNKARESKDQLHEAIGQFIKQI